MKKNVHTYLTHSKPAPLAESESALLWEQVAQTLVVRQVVPATITAPFAFWRQPAFAFAFGIMLVVGSSLTAQAANQSIPGDILYPLDRALEDIHLAVTPTTKRPELRYRFAEERVTELAKLVATQPTDPAVTPEARITSLEREIDTVLPTLTTEQQARVQEDIATIVTPIREQYRTQNQTADNEVVATSTPTEQIIPTDTPSKKKAPVDLPSTLPTIITAPENSTTPERSNNQETISGTTSDTAIDSTPSETEEKPDPDTPEPEQKGTDVTQPKESTEPPKQKAIDSSTGSQAGKR